MKREGSHFPTCKLCQLSKLVGVSVLEFFLRSGELTLSFKSKRRGEPPCRLLPVLGTISSACACKTEMWAEPRKKEVVQLVLMKNDRLGSDVLKPDECGLPGRIKFNGTIFRSLAFAPGQGFRMAWSVLILPQKNRSPGAMINKDGDHIVKNFGFKKILDKACLCEVMTGERAAIVGRNGTENPLS